MVAQDTWGLGEGDEIVPGRHAVELLGGGRRYEAYLAWDDELWTLVVAKLVRPSLVDDRGTLAGLAGEVHALEALNHPAIVRSFGAVLSGERPHVVLEYLDGPRLSTLIRRHGVIAEQLLPLALELCSALHYMSTVGIVHLDVKPRNVIMSAPPRLIDLSVATPAADVTRLASPTGTDAYMAPEQCDPSRFEEIGPASDVWGLGVTLYEALTRALPFREGAGGDGAPAEERYPQLVDEPTPMRVDPGSELAAVIRSCLEKRPQDRPTALELASTLEPWVAALPQARLGLFRPGGRARSSVFAPA
ncbi:MAG TPA: serine/threonine-protein kinase [Gaiellaceae bacterium]